jgi:hypothetical protein
MALLFSQRVGLKPAKKALQHRALDQETRNGLWSVMDMLYNSYHAMTSGGIRHAPHVRAFDMLMSVFWTEYFKEASDTYPESDATWKRIRQQFFAAAWNEVLDCLEFTSRRAKPEWIEGFVKECNGVFEKESCVYRFVSGQVVEITSEVELEAIDTAITSTSKDVAEHVQKALRFLSDRTTPDYRNSIKESVSAIEAAARRTTGQPNAVLSDAVKKLNETSPIHPALVKMILDLYGYAGDEGGVRHANKENGRPVTQSEARLILVLSSALCGFLATKSPATRL